MRVNASPHQLYTVHLDFNRSDRLQSTARRSLSVNRCFEATSEEFPSMGGSGEPGLSRSTYLISIQLATQRLESTQNTSGWFIELEEPLLTRSRCDNLESPTLNSHYMHSNSAEITHPSPHHHTTVSGSQWLPHSQNHLLEPLS
jgi:hypothetical protein